MNKTRVMTFFYYISMLVLFSAAAVVLYVGYLLFWPATVLQPLKQPYDVTTKEVVQGDEITYVVNYCKYLNPQGVIKRELISEDGIAVDMQQQPVNLPTGCPLENKAKFLIKDSIPEGTYHLFITVTYKVNQLREEPYYLKTDTFNVVAKQGSTSKDTCDTFTTHQEAQQAFNSDPEKYTNLDGDNDGIVCERR